MPKSSPEPAKVKADATEGTELIVSVAQFDAEPATEHRYPGHLNVETANGQLRILQDGERISTTVIWGCYPAGSWCWCRRVVKTDPQPDPQPGHITFLQDSPDGAVTPIL